MLGPEDIPGIGYIKAGVWIVRFLRKIKLTGILRNSRERIILATVAKLHVGSTHEMRKFSVGNYMSPEFMDDPEASWEPFNNLAGAYRNVFSEMLEISPEHLHCTIKVCNIKERLGKKEKLEKKEKLGKKDWPVHTIARSSLSNRPPEFYPEFSHKVGENSSFAPLVGCNDKKNTWVPNVYRCFACNDLIKHSKRYACSRENWQNYFNSTMVFPLRYRKGREPHTIMGFLTIDSSKTNVFGNIPDIFDYKDAPDDYLTALGYSSAYHIGGIIADTLATMFYLQEVKKGEGNNEANKRIAEV